MFALHNGKYYLTGNRKPCKTRDDAQMFNSRESASKFLTDSPKSVKNLSYTVVELVENQKAKNEECVANLCIIPNFFTNTDIDICVSEYQQFLQQSVSNKSLFEKELEEVDGTIQDILHAAEFYTLNASRGFKLYKMLHEQRCRRRELKDMIFKLEVIENATIQDWLSGKVMARLNGLSRRTYQPRVLNELFEKG